MTSTVGDTSATCALLLLFIVSIGNALRCEYVSTLNITGGIENADGSIIIYNNMSFARDQYERFDYVLLADGTRQTVEPHTRACLDNTNLPCKFIDSIDIENGTMNIDQSITFGHMTFSNDRYATFDYALEETVDGLMRKAVKRHTRGCLANKLPCEYFESVDISDGTLADDGSVTLEHMTFSPEQYNIISYEIKNGNIRKSVSPHRRGCVCNRQACVRLCCKIGQLFVAGMGCVEHKDAAAANISMNVRTKGDQLRHAHLSDHFAYVSGKSCPEYYALTQPYELNHFGELRVNERRHSHMEYCLMVALNETTQEPEIRINMCFASAPLGKYAFLPYGMLLSLPFIFVTILVYVCIPELRNVHGRCLVCYLTGLAIGYSVLACVQLNGNEHVPETLCKSAGYIIYFAFSAAFLWLSAISFDLWWTLGGWRGCNQLSEKSKFSIYFVYAWGLALLFTLFAYGLDNYTDIVRIKPGIGEGTCFLKHDRLTQTIFFYLPIAIIIVINSTFFILTARRIHRVQRDVSKIVSRGDSNGKQTKFENHKDNFSLFLRLFIMMGVTWSMEVISWAISPDSIFFHLTDAINITQGVLIFILFVCKPKIKRLILKFWRNCFNKTKIGSQEETHASSLSSRTSNLRLNQMHGPVHAPPPRT